ncbi:MAG: hypothetical protein COX62_06040 [Deltaproteobacteria bacterium CG_4_10_14_0_2_um_filter_43_8]|nr:MAG: hypothetical protein COV43_07230 [Deltaproteobacteria bacterium CG11_big_fil_rev_8_21_14_0_20_42_23]PJA19761.1 MAG: hypothetical protein COX62_06040 [Deltaproteobacteria bacterium CG_4_10_14_0_2_um_filter_43_8]PJC64188.1 MAG: hypothetical protein CO021_05595 [Deltaproteobacteria bacterium CG_4_9_14_0_2_um_filter_42_21]
MGSVAISRLFIDGCMKKLLIPFFSKMKLTSRENTERLKEICWLFPPLEERGQRELSPSP